MLSGIIELVLFLWQLPQNILGLIFAICLTDYETKYKNKTIYVHCNSHISSFSLGNFIIMNRHSYSETSVKHELGHQKQSKYLGWFYLLIIAIPSLLGNIYDRLFHEKWSYQDRLSWYYNLPWEKSADKLGKVNRIIARM